MTEVAALGLRVDGTENVEKATDALGGFSDAGERAQKSTDGLGKESQKAAPKIKGIGDESKRSTSSVQALSSAAKGLGLAIGALAAASALKGFADQWSDMQSVVGAAIGDMSQAGDAMNRVLEIANASYSPLEQTVSVYTRNVSVFKDLGRSAQQAADFTEAMNHALVTTATRGQDAEVVINSLSRSLATGGLNAMAFDTIVSRSPRVLKAMADELGVTTSALRQMAVDGKVTSDVIATGLVKSLESLRKEAGDMDATIGDAAVRVGNNMLALVGQFSEASGAGQAVADVIFGFAGVIKDATGSMVSFGATIAPIFSGIASVLVTVIENSKLAVIALAGFYAPAMIGGLAGLAKTLTVGVAGGIKAVTAALAANPIGIAIAAVAVAGYALYSAFSEAKSGADALRNTLSDMQSPLSETVEKFNKLSKDQQANKLVEYTRAFEEGSKKAGAAFDALIAAVSSDQLSQIGVPRKAIDELTQSLRDAKSQGEALSPVLTDFATKFNIPSSALDSWVKLAGGFSEAEEGAQGVKNVLDAVKKSLDVLSTSASNVNKGMDKWDEYVKKLTDARDMIGLNARQLGEFEAAQAGANSVQKEMAGIITSQTDAYKKLQSAIEGKDKKAAEAAQSNIRALDIERQKVELLAIKTNALIAATNAFARGEVSGDVASGILKNMLAGFAQAEAAIKVSKEAEDQIKNIYSNTSAKTTGGGGASKNDELKNTIKQLQLQKETLGMTEEAAARYEIEIAKGSETDRKRALSLYDQVQAWKETEKAMQSAIDSSRQYLAFQQEMEVFQQKLALDSAGAGMGRRQREIAEADLAIRQEYAQKRLELEMAQQVKETALTQEQYDERLAMFQQFEEQKLLGVQQSAEARALAEADWTNGMSRAWEDFAVQAQDIAGQTEEIFTGMLNSFTTGFGNAFEKMIFDSENLGDAMRNVAQGMARAVVNALAQMAAQWLVYQAVQLLVGKTTQTSAAISMAATASATALQAGLNAFSSTAAIPVVGPAAAPAAMAAALAVTTPLAAAVGMTAMAGMAHDGIDSIPQTGTWLLEKGERVTTANTSAKLDATLARVDSQLQNNERGMMPSSAPIINVIEDRSRAGTQEITQTEDGGYTASIFVAAIMGGGEEAQVLESVYGLQRHGT